jgi:hypothetical protein
MEVTPMMFGLDILNIPTSLLPTQLDQVKLAGLLLMVTKHHDFEGEALLSVCIPDMDPIFSYFLHVFHERFQKYASKVIYLIQHSFLTIQ